MSEAGCIFCAIVAGDIPADVIVSDPDVIVIRDLAPVAPSHLLAIPRRHLADFEAIEETDAPLVGAILAAARRGAAAEGISDDGYRIVVNIGDNGGNTVAHLHFHVIGGRQMAWPPG